MASKLIDRTTRFMSLREAARLIGRRLPDWQDGDLDQLSSPFEESSDREAWDRANHAKTQLESWVRNLVIPAYGGDSDGRKSVIEPKWLTTPYFKIDVILGNFLVFEDLWADMVVDGPALIEKIEGIRQLKPRQAQTYEWLPIVNQAWITALDLDPPRTQAAIVGKLDQWYLDGPGKGVASPDPKQLKELARIIVNHLGDRRITGKLLSSETSPDEEADRE